MALGAPAHGTRADDWPMLRHDVRRTGASAARLAMTAPTVAWQRYLGGALTAPQVLDLDVDGDGRVEIVYASAGRLLAKKADDVAVWESPIVGVDRVEGVYDLDEDGTAEILAIRNFPTPAPLVVIAPRDGRVLWELPAGVVDWIGGVSVGDLDGDGHADLHVGTGNCGRQTTLRASVAYSFCGAGGCSYASARELWRLTPGTPAGDAPGSCGDGGVIGEVDGDPGAELVLPWEYAEVPIYRGADGTRERALPRFSPGNYDRRNTTALLVQLDADPALELLTFTNADNGAQGARRVAAFDVGAGPLATLLWEVTGPDRGNDRVAMDLGNPVADLDGDGAPEVVVSRLLGSEGRYTTWVRDAATGAVRATLPAGTRVEGVADLTGDGRPEIVVSTGDGALAAFGYAAGIATERWRLPGRAALTLRETARGLSSPAPTRLLTMQLDDDAAPELLVAGRNARGEIASVHALDADGSEAREIASFAADEGTSILLVTRIGPMTRDHEQPVVVTSDGYLLVLDRALRVTNRIVGMEFSQPGMRIGGFYSGPGGPAATPVTGQVAGAPSIFVSDSRGSLLRLDAREASPLRPPAVVDDLPGARFPVVVDLDGAGPLELVVRRGDEVSLRRAAPGLPEVWTTSGLGRAGMWGDVVPQRVSASAQALAGTRFDPGTQLVIFSLDPATGATRWTSPPRLFGYGQGNYGLPAVADLTGDGVEDVATVGDTAVVLDGATGAYVFDQGRFMANGAMLVADVDGDGAREVFAHGGWFHNRVLSMGPGASMTERWRSAQQENRDAYATLVTCGGAAHFVVGTYGAPDLFAVRARDGMVAAHRLLVAGEVRAPGPLPAGVRAGALGNATSVADLVGDGRPGVLVGSTDGFLYGVDACTLDRRFALDLRAPVGEPIVADTDGDGADEIVTTIGSGYLVSIRQAALPAPAVRDVDPSRGDDADVDTLDTRDTLHAAWDAVPGASSYLVGVFTESGSEVRFPNFRDVGAVTSVTLDMLPLRVGQRYVIAVQAVGRAGPGAEGRSDGVRVTDALGPRASVSVSPDPSWPAGGVEPTVTGACSDRVGLRRVRVEVLDVSGATTLATVADVDAAGAPERSAGARWSGTTAGGATLGAGDYQARATCVDLEGREERATSTFTLDPSATPPPPDGGAPMPDGGRRVPAAMDESGCGCRAAGARAGAVEGAGPDARPGAEAGGDARVRECGVGPRRAPGAWLALLGLAWIAARRVTRRGAARPRAARRDAAARPSR
jgi:hypothetical protein